MNIFVTTRRRIESFSTNLWNQFKDTYCVPDIPKEENDISYELAQDKYLTLAIYSIILTCFGCFRGIINRDITIFISLRGVFFIYLLKKKKLTLLKLILFGSMTCIPYIASFVLNDNEVLLANKDVLALVPLFWMIGTQSIMTTFVLYIINGIQAYFIFHKEVLIAFNVQPNTLQRILFEKEINSTFGFSFLIYLMLIYQIKTREKLIGELDHQKRQLFEMNKKLKDANQKLEIINQKLKETINGKENLLLSLSHEVRNPLNIISGSAELALFEKHNEKINFYLETIKDTVALTTHLITNLLDGSKMENNELKITLALLDTKVLMEKIWNISKILILKKGLKGRIIISKNMPKTIKTDKIRIIQIIYNLVGNAVKFTENGAIGVILTWIKDNENISEMLKPTEEELFKQFLEETKGRYPLFPANRINQMVSQCEIIENNINYKKDDVQMIFEDKHNVNINNMKPKTLQYTQLFSKYNIYDLNNFTLISDKSALYQEKGFLKIEIIDTGCGIKEDQLPNLFKKFNQVGVNTHNRLGSGLGLWIVKNICNKLDGDIKASSTFKKGSIFVALLKSY